MSLGFGSRVSGTGFRVRVWGSSAIIHGRGESSWGRGGTIPGPLGTFLRAWAGGTFPGAGGTFLRAWEPSHGRGNLPMGVGNLPGGAGNLPMGCRNCNVNSTG